VGGQPEKDAGKGVIKRGIAGTDNRRARPVQLDALKTTREKVNGSVAHNTIPVTCLIWWLSRDFRGIFVELFPGNFAKLQLADGQDLIACL
jgi:hypothetical protein